VKGDTPQSHLKLVWPPPPKPPYDMASLNKSQTRLLRWVQENPGELLMWVRAEIRENGPDPRWSRWRRQDCIVCQSGGSSAQVTFFAAPADTRTKLLTLHWQSIELSPLTKPSPLVLDHDFKVVAG
jgi:hypothetical protein